MPSDQDLELPRAYHVLPPHLHVAEQHLAVRCCVCGPRQGGHKGRKRGHRWPLHVEITPRMAGKAGSVLARCKTRCATRGVPSHVFVLEERREGRKEAAGGRYKGREGPPKGADAGRLQGLKVTSSVCSRQPGRRMSTRGRKEKVVEGDEGKRAKTRKQKMVNKRGLTWKAI